MKIVGIGFSNFRSVGSSPVIVNLDKRVNLLIGANNSGKSNVLELLRRLKKEGLATISLSETDFHHRDGNRPLTLILDVQDDEGKLPAGTRRFHFQISGGTISAWLATLSILSTIYSSNRSCSKPFMKAGFHNLTKKRCRTKGNESAPF
jgi:predicted ATP-dependent endonuclease of OLD family